MTGAGSGIGRGIALALARAGARVAELDRDAEAARTVAKQAEGVAVACDVSEPGAVAAAAAEVAERLGPARVLVNHA